jgi:tetratricopeptide (TPR) repeat protein
MIDHEQGRYQGAADHFRQALALFREAGDRSGEAIALNGLGNASLLAGKPQDARIYYASPLGLASQADEKYQQARAHHGLARSHDAAGDRGEARHHWQHALILYENLATPEAEQVRLAIAGSRAS